MKEKLEAYVQNLIVENEKRSQTIKDFSDEPDKAVQASRHRMIIQRNSVYKTIKELQKILDEDNDLITEEKLDALESFGKQQDGIYSDWFEFSIIPIKDKDDKIIKWSFCLFEEVDGTNIRICYVTKMEEIKDLYKAITKKELS